MYHVVMNYFFESICVSDYVGVGERKEKERRNDVCVCVCVCVCVSQKCASHAVSCC